MEELVCFLEEMGIYPDPERTQIVVFEDGIVYISVEEDGFNRLSVELFSEVTIADASIEDLTNLSFLHDLIDEEDEDAGSLAFAPRPKSTKSELRVQKIQEKQVEDVDMKALVDQLLDEYNDRMAMYMQFGDSEYYERCQQILRQLEKMTS